MGVLQVYYILMKDERDFTKQKKILKPWIFICDVVSKDGNINKNKLYVELQAAGYPIP